MNVLKTIPGAVCGRDAAMPDGWAGYVYAIREKCPVWGLDEQTGLHRDLMLCCFDSAKIPFRSSRTGRNPQ